MIVKKIKCQQADKPKVWQIGDLVDYIRNPQKVNAHEKIAHAGENLSENTVLVRFYTEIRTHFAAKY